MMMAHLSARFLLTLLHFHLHQRAPQRVSPRDSAESTRKGAWWRWARALFRRSEKSAEKDGGSGA